MTESNDLNPRAHQSVRVRAFDCTLVWPLRIHSSGDLRKRPNHGASYWLDRFADYIANHGGSKWRHDTSFGEKPVYQAPQEAFQEFVYFHPFIQDLLYHQEPCRRSMAVLCRDDIKQAHVDLRSGDRVRIDVRSLRLFLFTTDVLVLAVELTNPTCSLWSAGGTDLSLPDAMNILNQIRRVYPPFWNENGESPETPRQVRWFDDATQVGDAGDFDKPAPYCDHVVNTRRPLLAAHWQTLLSPLTEFAPDPSTQCQDLHPGLYYSQIEDDRVPTHAFLAVDEPKSITPAEFMRLTFIDRGGTDWACSRDFLHGKEAEHWYDRFWNYGTRYLVSGYGFLLVTRFESPVCEDLRRHMRHPYFKMFLIAQLQKASLLVAWGRLSRVLQDYAAAPAGDLSQDHFHVAHRWLAEDLASYSAIFEFSEVTNHVQGRELFSLMRRHLGSAELYAELLKQLEFARMVEQGNYNEKLVHTQLELQKIANRQVSIQISLQNAANFWIPLFLTFSFLGMSIGMTTFEAWVKNPHSLSFSGFSPWEASLKILLLLSIVGATWLVFRLLFKLLADWPAKEEK